MKAISRKQKSSKDELSARFCNRKQRGNHKGPFIGNECNRKKQGESFKVI